MMSAESRFKKKKDPANQRNMKHGASDDVALVLRKGGIAALRTDTLYGVVGTALRQETVERIYRLKKREQDKPFIILIGHAHALTLFGITPSREVKKAIAKLWPGKNSIIMQVPDRRQFMYLHRGKGSLAFRLPDDKDLCALLKRTGPLVAPSANEAGELPAKTIHEAREIFGESIDRYIDGGRVRATRPSKLYEVTDSGLKRLR